MKFSFAADVFGIPVVALRGSGVTRDSFDSTVLILEAMVDPDEDYERNSQWLVSSLAQVLLVVVPDTGRVQMAPLVCWFVP